MFPTLTFRWELEVFSCTCILHKELVLIPFSAPGMPRLGYGYGGLGEGRIVPLCSALGASSQALGQFGALQYQKDLKLFESPKEGHGYRGESGGDTRNGEWLREF